MVPENTLSVLSKVHATTVDTISEYRCNIGNGAHALCHKLELIFFNRRIWS